MGRAASRKASKALKHVPLRRREGQTRLHTDHKSVVKRVAQLRAAGLPLRGQIVELGDGFTVRIADPSRLRDALTWFVENHCSELHEHPGDNGCVVWAPYRAGHWRGPKKWGLKIGADGAKLAFQLGDGRDGGLKAQLVKMLAIWADDQPLDDHTYDKTRALREFMEEIERLRKRLKVKGLLHEYVHGFVHSPTSVTTLHPDSNLACESAARAILSSLPRTTEFVLYKGKGDWPSATSSGQRLVGVAYGGVLATASMLGGMPAVAARVVDPDLPDDDDPKHGYAPALYLKHEVNRSAAKLPGFEPGISLVFSGKWTY